MNLELVVLVLLGNIINCIVGTKHMMMGGTVKDFLDELLQGGDISETQYDFLLDETRTLSLRRGHHAKDNIFRLDSDIRIRSYIDAEVIEGRIVQDTANYLSTLLNLNQVQENTSHSLKLHTTNALSINAAAQYTGNGNVVRLGRIRPESLNSDELYNGIWGYAVGRREYALQCNSRGLHIIDVTSPSSPFPVQKISMSGGTIWRDVEVYGSYAYVAAQSGGNFFVVDLSNLSGTTPHQPNSNPITRYADRGYKDYGHTLSVGDGLLFLNTAGGTKGCQIFDLKQNPWDPPLISSWSGAGNDCHDSFARSNVASRDLLFSADGYSGKYRLLDITNIRSVGRPIKIGETPSIGSVYAHSMYPSEDNNYLYAFDEQNNFDIIVWDISNPSTPFQVSAIKWSGESTEGDAIVHNGQVRGNYLLTAYYEAGFRVFDISNPANAKEVGKYETYRDPDGDGSYGQNIRTEYEGAWNLYSFLPSGNVLVSDISSGTFIFRVNDVAAPSAPAGITLTLLLGNSRARLEWSSSDRATGYTVKRSTTRGGPYTKIKSNIIETRYIDNGLLASNSAVYYYVVTATNAGGESSSTEEVATRDVPTPSPSVTPIGCEDGLVPIIVEIKTDNYPKEIFWKVINACDNTLIMNDGGYELKHTNYMLRKCVPRVKYNFLIEDGYGDGICCRWGEGSYNVTFEGSSFDGGEFKKEDSRLFGGECSSDVSPSEPTRSPTTIPTLNPTSSPTQKPTSSPTQSPTPSQRPRSNEQCGRRYRRCRRDQDCCSNECKRRRCQ